MPRTSDEELAEILADELELPRIEPKGKEILEKDKDRYTGISHQGPNSLRNFKRSSQLVSLGFLLSLFISNHLVNIGNS